MCLIPLSTVRIGTRRRFTGCAKLSRLSLQKAVLHIQPIGRCNFPEHLRSPLDFTSIHCDRYTEQIINKMDNLFRFYALKTKLQPFLDLAHPMVSFCCKIHCPTQNDASRFARIEPTHTRRVDQPWTNPTEMSLHPPHILCANTKYCCLFTWQSTANFCKEIITLHWNALFISFTGDHLLYKVDFL